MAAKKHFSKEEASKRPGIYKCRCGCGGFSFVLDEQSIFRFRPGYQYDGTFAVERIATVYEQENGVLKSSIDEIGIKKISIDVSHL